MAEAAKTEAAEKATDKPAEKAAELTLEEQQAKFTPEEAAAELERVKAELAESIENEKRDHVEAEKKRRAAEDARTWEQRRAEARASRGFGGSAKKPTAPKPVDEPDGAEQERAAKEAALPPQDGRESIFDPAPGKTETDVLERLEARANGEFGNEQVAPDEDAA